MSLSGNQALMSDLIEQLAERLRNLGVVPAERRLWGYEQIADYSGYSVSNVQQRICCRPDFPQRITAMPGAQPRWPAGEVMSWFEARR
jgi:predicted DNA-binding transcriptional regulator AlpA